MRRNKKLNTAAELHGKTTGRWTDEEHERFEEGKNLTSATHFVITEIQIFKTKLTFNLTTILAIRLYGKNWKKVTQHVGTRISAQVRSHAQKVLKDYSPAHGPSVREGGEGGNTSDVKASQQAIFPKGDDDNDERLAKNVIAQARQPIVNLMENIPVTHVDCNERSHPLIKRSDDTVLKNPHSSVFGDGMK